MDCPHSRRLVDHYAVLDVTASVTMAELRSSYRRMALRTHPDKGGSPEDFRQVLEAFAVLSSSRTRAAYDSSLRARKEAAGSRSGRTARDTRRKSAAAEEQQKAATAKQQERMNKTQKKHPQEGPAQPASSSPQPQADVKQEPKSSSVSPPTAGNDTAHSEEAQGKGCGSDAEEQSTQPSSIHPAQQGVSACMARLRAVAVQMPRTQREASLQALLPQLRSRLLEFMQGHKKPEVSPGKAQQATAERRHSKRGMCGTEGPETPQERVLGDPTALAPVFPRSDSSTSSASDESDIDEVLALEDEECSMLLAIENAADVDVGLGEDDSGESDPDCKNPTAATRASKKQSGSGFRGVFRKVRASGMIDYQAAVVVGHVSVRTCHTASVEESLDFHIILFQLRESVEQGVDGGDGVEGPLAFEQSFRAAYRQRQEELSKMSLSFAAVFSAFGINFHTPTTTSLEEALEMRARLLAAREQGVSALQAYLLEVLMAGCTNVRRRSRSWTLSEAQAFVGRFDTRSKAMQLKREALQQLSREALQRRKEALEERLQQRRTQRALKDARKLERRQQRLQQRWQRVAGYAQRALQQEQKLSASSQQQAAAAAAAAARAKVRAEAQERRVAERSRRKLRSWTSMKNLTFEEQQAAAAETAAAAAAASRNTCT
ncbi:unnamed protein product [Polarella glacialis]|uniref:J domain-containing protein n=1 Tax=Polarella glacialis TaxID=89957 RepID=A0A813G2X6_POLGL|nr:unnamed protein product [Polarella glacialis]CAE8740881.1 unnamed protein product [Polarella glacialis]